jgi:hypothetical protein
MTNNPFEEDPDVPSQNVEDENRTKTQQNSLPEAKRSPSKSTKKVDPATKRRWIETLSKAKPRLNSAWRTTFEEIIEYLLE